MKLPSPEEYLRLVEAKAPGSLGSLHNYNFLEKDGNTCYEKGRYSVIFKTEYHSKYYAVKFFLDDDHELFRRYVQVQNYLNDKPLSWKVAFEFLDKEFYPVLKMDWVDGLSFAQHIDEIIFDPLQIGRLQSKFVKLSQSLEENGVGHGDLNLNHIRFVKEEQEYVLKLIDYDSVFIPSFKGKDCLRAGSANFQHPMRITSDYSETIDRFSIWVFITALEAFKTDASLWKFAAKNGYDQSKELLFNFRDFAFPEQSRAFQILRSYDNKALNFYADKLTAFCNSKSVKTVEAPQLYNRKDFYPVQKKETIVNEKKTYEAAFNKKEQQPPAYFSKTSAPKAIVIEKKIIAEKQEKLIHSKTDVQAAQIKNPKTSIKVKKGKGVVAIAIAVAILLAFVFFIQLHTPSSPAVAETISGTTQKKLSTQQLSAQKETFFTPANVTQFLSQLYQSYNSRDLPSILYNYADTVRYYDAGATPKNKLSGILQNLFIRPAGYKCHPDLATLRFTVKENTCVITLVIHETLKADENSQAQNYSSKIQYTVDRNFKILAEKNAG